MYIYIFSFFLSTFFLFIACNIKNKIVGKVFEIMGLLIPCLIGGLRDLSIGTDVNVYVEPLFDLSSNSTTFKQFFNKQWYSVYQYNYVRDYELLFIVIVYVTEKIFNSISVLLFIIELMIIFPFYYGIKKFKIKNDAWIIMLFYYLLFYNIGFNAMRQMIGISIAFFGLSCLINENDKIKFSVFTIIAFLFHRSSLLIMIVYIIYNILNNNKIKNRYIFFGKLKINFKSIIIFLFFLISIFIFYYNNLLLKIMGILNINIYSGYIMDDAIISFNKIIKSFPILLFILLNYKKLKNINNFSFYFSMYLMYFITSNLSSSSNQYAGRISYIFESFLPLLLYLIINVKNKKMLNSIIIISYLIILWYIEFVYFGRSQTVPYIFINNKNY